MQPCTGSAVDTVQWQEADCVTGILRLPVAWHARSSENSATYTMYMHDGPAKSSQSIKQADTLQAEDNAHSLIVG
jgi:hypothetical protein